MGIRKVGRGTLGALATLAVLITAGCGSSAGDGSGSSGGDAGSGPPIKIGVIADLSGPTAALQTGVARGIQTKVDEVNEAGGVSGREIEVVVEDDRYDVPTGINAYNKLVKQEKVVGIAGFMNSDLQIAVKPNLERDKVPTFATVPGEDLLVPVNPYFFGAGANFSDQVDLQAGFAAKLSGEEKPKIALVHYGSAIGYEMVELIEERDGDTLEFVREEILGPTATSADATIQNIAAADADAIILHASPHAGLLLHAQEKFGLEIPVIGITSGAVGSHYEGLSPELGSLLYWPSAALPAAVEVEGTADMLAAAEAAGYEDLASDPTFAHGYVVATVMLTGIEGALEEADTITGEDVAAALVAAESIDTNGLSSPLDYTEESHTGITGLVPLTWDYDAGDWTSVGTFEEYADMLTGGYGK